MPAQVLPARMKLLVNGRPQLLAIKFFEEITDITLGIEELGAIGQVPQASLTRQP